MSVEFSLTIVLVKQKKLAMFKVSGFPRRRFLLMSGLSAIGVGVVANAKGNAVTVEQSQRALDIGKQVYIWGLPTIDFNHSSLVRLNYTMNTMRWFTSRLIFTFIFSIILLVYVPTASAAGNVDSSVTPPGGEKSAKTKILETGAAVLQNQTPVDAVNVYVDAFHFHNGNLDRQLEAHHYCSVVNEDFIQCVLYDHNSKNARLIGIEYIISGKSFQTLPEDEKEIVAQPCLRGEVGPADRPRYSGNSRACSDGKDRFDLRQDLAHLECRGAKHDSTTWSASANGGVHG